MWILPSWTGTTRGDATAPVSLRPVSAAEPSRRRGNDPKRRRRTGGSGGGASGGGGGGGAARGQGGRRQGSGARAKVNPRIQIGTVVAPGDVVARAQHSRVME